MKRDGVGRLATWAVVLAIAGAAVWLAREHLLKEEPRDRRIAQRVRLLDAPKPPPPPPPPKVEEKPLEVRPGRELDVPSDLAAQAPGPKEPAERLAVDAEGTGGSDAFGLAARRGGRDITSIGTEKPGGGGSGVAWAWYGGVIKRHLEDVARTEKRLQGRAYQVVVQVWVAPDGRVVKFAVLGSSGHEEVDRALREVLAGAPPLREPPPQDMPQPVRLRFTSRVAG
jgi:protein TonB